MYYDPFYSRSARMHIKLDRFGKAWTKASRDPWGPAAVEALLKAGMKKQAEQLANCGQPSGWVRECAADATHFSQPILTSCRKRYCPRCQFIRNREFVLSYIDAVMEAVATRPKGYQIQHLVFTTRHSLLDPDITQHVTACRKAIYASLQRVLKKVLRKKDNRNKKQRREVNLNAHHIGYIVGGEWGLSGGRLHFHLLYLGPDIPYAELRAAWTKKTNGEGELVLARRFPARRGDIGRLMRYVVKLTLPSADELPTLVNALSGGRQSILRGIWYGKKQPVERRTRCPQCGKWHRKRPATRH